MYHRLCTPCLNPVPPFVYIRIQLFPFSLDNGVLLFSLSFLFFFFLLNCTCGLSCLQDEQTGMGLVLYVFLSSLSLSAYSLCTLSSSHFCHSCNSFIQHELRSNHGPQLQPFPLFTSFEVTVMVMAIESNRIK